jgi:hypothetical protein
MPGPAQLDSNNQMDILDAKLRSIWQCKTNPYHMIRIESAPYCKLQYLYGEPNKYGQRRLSPRFKDDVPTAIIDACAKHAHYSISTILLPERTIKKYHNRRIPTYSPAIQASLLDLYYEKIHEPD